MNKLYIMQRTRCDWFDIFNVLYATKGKLDLKRLIKKMGADAPLVASVLGIFCWLCPGRVKLFSGELWPQLGMTRPDDVGPDIDTTRVRYLDSRPWFLPALKPDEHPFAEGS